VKTTAEITGIHDIDEDTTVYVTFEVDGKKYGGKLGYHHPGMRKGGKVQIFYAPHNPRKFRYAAASGHIPTVILSIVGVGCMVAGGIFAKPRRRKHLLQNGKKIMAEFRKLVEGNFVDEEEKRCFFLVCEYTDKASSVVYTFKSEHFWKTENFSYTGCFYDPRAPVYVPVYVQENDYSKYYVDIDSFFNEQGNQKIEP